MTAAEQREFSERLQRQLSQISGMGASSAYLGYRGALYENGHDPNVDLRHAKHKGKPEINLEAAFNAKHSKTFIDNMDFEFVRNPIPISLSPNSCPRLFSSEFLMSLPQLKFLSYDDLECRIRNLDSEMEKEIDELRQRYQAKRQPIMDAMDSKRKRQQNF